MSWFQSALAVVGLEPKDIVPLWSALVAATVALVAVYMQNRGMEKRHREDLANAAEAARITREMQMRREIFMGVADALARQREYIVAQSNLDLTEKELAEKLTGVSAAVFRFHLVATEASLKAFSVSDAAFGKFVADMVMERLRVVRERRTLDTLNYQQKLQQDFSSEILQDIKRHVKDEVKNQARWDAMQSQFADSQKKVGEISVKVQEQIQVIARENLEIWKKAARYSLLYSKVLIPLLVEVRKEIDIPLKMELLADSLEQSHEVSMKLIDGMGAQMGDFIQPPRKS
jgi:hypothetical protein